MKLTKDDAQMETMIGSNTQIDGNLTIKGTVKVDGRINGDVKADCVILGEKAYLKGNIEASSIAVAGYVEGNIKSRELLDVKTTGKVLGDVFTNKLIVLEGGSIDGNISMKSDASKVVDIAKQA